MQRNAFITTLGLVLFSAVHGALATESAFHNDMDGDGRSDLVWFNTSTGAIVYWPATNASSYVMVRVQSSTPGYTYDPRAWLLNFTMSDYWFDPSRTMPLVRSRSGTTQIGLFPGGQYFWASPNGVDFAGAVAHGDFNGNGVADLFYRDNQSGRNVIEFDSLLHDWGASYRDAPAVGSAWDVAGTGDFDGDGRSDVLWRNAATGSNAIWRSANAATRIAISAVTDTHWKIAAIGDFNGDGRSDILWRNASNGRNVIWKSGIRLTPQAVTTVADLHWKVAATGDFDGDGRWDLVWRNTTTGANVLWKAANSSKYAVLPAANLSWDALM